MARSTLSQLARTHATAGTNQSKLCAEGQIDITFRAIFQRGNLALERLHLHGQCTAQIAQLPQILELGFFGSNAGR